MEVGSVGGKPMASKHSGKHPNDLTYEIRRSPLKGYSTVSTEINGKCLLRVCTHKKTTHKQLLRSNPLLAL